MTSSGSNLEPIPTHPGKPLIGNVLDIDPKLPALSLANILRTHGEIVQLNLAGRKIVLAGSQRLVHELCDQKRFRKTVAGALQEVRHLAGDGLFTAYSDEENWAIAHRILIPTFGPLSIKNMFDGMKDIAVQLLQKWARFGDERINVPADFTRLTLDTIALCTFSHRFNSFYSETEPAMVAAMGRSLAASGDRIRRLPGTSWLYSRSDKEYQEDIATQHRIADELVNERKVSGETKGDLLDAMLNGRDPVTGKGLSMENIRYQLVTFLIAGHETTSGLLSFLFYFLLKDPSCAAKIKEEVDRVCGAEPIEFAHLAKFEYIDAALKETLRLKATAPAFSVEPLDGDQVIGRQYTIPKGQGVTVILDVLHRDPKVWGEDADAFRPERMLNGGFKNLPPDSWKPFGSGVRACIGRPFAWQESLLVVAAIFQNFDVRPHNVNYELAIKSTLTIKPSGFFMHARLRKDRDLAHSLGLSGAASQKTSQGLQTELKSSGTTADGPKMTILYGSNSGTCKALAEKLAGVATSAGMNPSLAHLDEYASRELPKEGSVAVITASYEGEPTDDARFFHQWLSDAPKDLAKGTKFAVFGCGHPDWANTYHAVPTFIDEKLAELGGERLTPRGVGDASSADLFDHYDDWVSSLLKTLGSESQKATAMVVTKVESHKRQKVLKYDTLGSGTVVSNTILTSQGVPEKRHIVFELPPEAEYRPGDYLEILPIAPEPFVRRVLARFRLQPDDVITLSKSDSTSSINLPLDTPLSAIDILGGFVELGNPVSSRTLGKLAAYASDEKEKAEISALADPARFEGEVAKKRLSLLDVLEQFSSVDMPLGEFLLSLPPMRIRQYSISSSPLDNPRHVSLTVSILQEPHASGTGQTYYGTATTYLASLIPGSNVHVGVRPSSANFHLPLDPLTPILMAGAGSGIAPFRGFLQERALQKYAGREVGPAMLFFGCKQPGGDDLYKDELAKWEADGIVSVRYAYSRSSEESFGCKHVQERVYHDREDIKPLFLAGARLYFCGSKKVATGVEDTAKQIHREITGDDEAKTEEWYKKMKTERFATDVFN